MDAPADPRTQPPLSGPEVETLRAFLDYHRTTLQLKTDGLSAEQLARTLAPSSMTLGGLVKHLAYVEDWWLNQVFAGNPEPEPWASADWTADPDWEWHSAASDTPAELHDLLARTIDVSDRLVDAALSGPDGLDAASVPESRRLPGATYSLRWILLHLVEEYSRHNGHADLIRESVDGSVGE